MTQLDAKMKVGLRIKELRNALGYSQEALAYSIEMSRTYFAEVETGKRNISIENIERIARGLGVSLREFFDSDLFTGWLGDGSLKKSVDARCCFSLCYSNIARPVDFYFRHESAVQDKAPLRFAGGKRRNSASRVRKRR